jgi:cell division protein FtsW (lipid II flippase)
MKSMNESKQEPSLVSKIIVFLSMIAMGAGVIMAVSAMPNKPLSGNEPYALNVFLWFALALVGLIVFRYMVNKNKMDSRPNYMSKNLH